MKVQILPPAKPGYRLTLSAEAFSLAVAKASPLAGLAACRRPDGRWDCFVTLAVADQLKQIADTGENLSDTVIRVLKKG